MPMPLTEPRVWLVPRGGMVPVPVLSVTWRWVCDSGDWARSHHQAFHLEGELRVDAAADVLPGTHFTLVFEQPLVSFQWFLVEGVRTEAAVGAETFRHCTFRSTGVPTVEPLARPLPPPEPAEELTTDQLRQLLGGAAGCGAAAFDAEGGFRISPSAN